MMPLTCGSIFIVLSVVSRGATMFLFFLLFVFFPLLCCCRCATVVAEQTVANVLVSFAQQLQDASFRACCRAPRRKEHQIRWCNLHLHCMGRASARWVFREGGDGWGRWQRQELWCGRILGRQSGGGTTKEGPRGGCASGGGRQLEYAGSSVRNGSAGQKRTGRVGGELLGADWYWEECFVINKRHGSYVRPSRRVEVEQPHVEGGPSELKGKKVAH